MIRHIHYPASDAIFRSRVRQPKDVHDVRILASAPRQFKTPGRTPAQRNGKYYEKKVLKYLAGQYSTLVTGPWISYADSKSDGRLCQPDALLFGADGKKVVILEVKRIHNLDAWFQLRKLYTPVIAALFPEASVSVCEVTMTFDPSTPWPESVAFCTSHADLFDLGSDFGVYQWRK